MLRSILRSKGLRVSKKEFRLQIVRNATQGSGDVFEKPTELSPCNASDESVWRYGKGPSSVPYRCDILVVGGGVMGSSVAYWLKQKVHKGLDVVVVEKDPTYCKSSTALSVGGLRQQFSMEENINMSLFGAEFIRNIDYYLGIPGEPAIDINFHPCGYLMLASEAGAETLENNSKLQNSLGAKNVLLTAKKLREIFPWLNTHDIAVGCLGLEKEGWFDPWSLLSAFKKKAISLGVQYVNGEVVSFGIEEFSHVVDFDPEDKDKFTSDMLRSVTVRTDSGEEKQINFSIAVIAAGACSGHVARLAGVGTGAGVSSVQLPVEPRKRYVYCFHCPEEIGLNTPLTVDPTGAYFRRDGLAGHYLCGLSPPPTAEPSTADLVVDDDYFYDKVWPQLAHRVRAFENIKMKSSWAGYYEYNTFDENGIIGHHPHRTNLIFATGFSGHGIQQAPAVGRAISEIIIDSTFLTIDLTRLGFKRIMDLEPAKEMNIV